MTPSPLYFGPAAREAEAHLATKTALLDAAERLFAMQGIEGASVRDITRAANANLGAINYHFGSKDRLALEVFARRLAPMNRDRVARLDALEKAAGKNRVKVEQIVDALIRPAVENVETRQGHEAAFLRLMNRCFQEPNAELKAFVEEQFAEVCERFDAAILRAMPDLPPGELFWRLNFLIGALHHGLEMWLRFDNLPCPKKKVPPMPLDREGLIQRVVAFVSAGLTAEVKAYSANGAH